MKHKVTHKSKDLAVIEGDVLPADYEDMGEQPRLSTKQRKKLTVKAMRNSMCMVTTACEKAGINRITYYRWLKKDKKFRQEIEALNERTLDFVESKHFQLIKAGSIPNILFHLKCKGRGRGYIEKQEIIHSVALTKEMKELTDEQLEEIIEG